MSGGQWRNGSTHELLRGSSYMSRARNSTSTGANADRGKYFESVKLHTFDASEFKDVLSPLGGIFLRCVVDA